jgi:hypothetical protein
VREAGHVVVEPADSADIEAIAARHWCRVVRRMPPISTWYVIEFEDGPEYTVLAVLDALIDDSQVRFAELNHTISLDD